MPTSRSEANKYVLQGEYAIMDLLPKPKLHIIAEHACFRLDEVLSLHMALGRSMEFTVIPWEEEDLGEQALCITDKIHGCEAMDELLILMDALNSEVEGPVLPSYRSYFTTWHDTFCVLM